MMDFTPEYWRDYRKTRGRRVVYVGMTGDLRLRALIMSVSKSAVRVRWTDNGQIDAVHPEHLRPA